MLAVGHPRPGLAERSTSSRQAAAGAKSVSDEGSRARSDAARSVGVLGAGHFTNDIYSSLLPAMLPVVLPALGLTVGAGGILLGAYQIVSAVVQPVIGHFADRRHLRWPPWAGMALSGLGAGLFGVAPSFWWLAVAVLV